MNLEMLRTRLAMTTNDGEQARLARAITEEEAGSVKDAEKRDPEPPTFR